MASAAAFQRHMPVLRSAMQRCFSSKPLEIRKVVTQVEDIRMAMGKPLSTPQRKVTCCVVVKNPLAGQGFVEDMTDMIDAGSEAGRVAAETAVQTLGAPVRSYGKAVMVGTNGDLEHGAAILHPKFGATVRKAIGHGVDIMPSTKKVVGPGASISVPLHDKDNVWNFPGMDGAEAWAGTDAPRPDELVVVLAVSSAERPFARIGEGAPNTFLVPKPE
eukprot:TRINITY_DN77664_c0_g1_i1.p2 TRINITY_DN77664_c0_g1~~TRINITY_DN77664_c0_g1_i1.p2  ORF type:complete len:217 (+),score=41.74 TRINITY_DN77664_c0_g1_i1:168-818(+)